MNDRTYVSNETDQVVPVPAGMKRIVVTMNVPEDEDIFNIVDELEYALEDAGEEIIVWESRSAFVSDWTEGKA